MRACYAYARARIITEATRAARLVPILTSASSNARFSCYGWRFLEAGKDDNGERVGE